MEQIAVRVAAVLDAPAEDVYATIADYRQGHPHILPAGSLYDLQVEQGGYGEGTIIRFKARALGVERSFYQRVSEPIPGRVLIEQDIDPTHNATTTFTVIPAEQSHQSHVEIRHTENASPGLKGALERLINSLIMTPILRKELKLLEGVARQSTLPSTPSPGPIHILAKEQATKTGTPPKIETSHQSEPPP